MLDKQLLKDVRRLVDDSLRMTYANPIEIGDYLYDLYLQHDRLDKLTLIVGRLNWRFNKD